jgi:hypothetical protein
MPEVLVFFARRLHHHLSYYQDWFEALSTHPGWSVDVVDTSTVVSLGAGLLRARRRSYDLIVYPYSFFYENQSSRRRAILAFAQDLRGTKVFFLENEYRFLREKLACAVSVGADYVTTQLPKDVADRAYGGLLETSRIIPLPHGVRGADVEPEPHGVRGADVEPELVFDESSRDVDLGFRGGSYPLYVGHRDRDVLVEFFSENARRLDLRVDLERSNLAPVEWRRFLRRCKGVLGCEAGSDFLEVNDGIRRRVVEYQLANPGATFDEIYRIFFKDYPDALSGRCVSSRHFDAIAEKTCQVMFPGRYNDILKADTHYLALARDFSNLDDVRARFRDVDYRRRMVEDAYAYVRAGHTLRHRIAEIVRWIGR